jgi:limonene-1,2-epoxide hydrolase
MGTMPPGETVAAFIAALTSGDLDTAASLCTEDLVFENVPLDPRIAQGRDTILTRLGQLVSMCERVEWEVSFQIESGESVVNERVDRFWFDEGVFAEVPVLARWTVQDGRISLWRDYYDFSMFDRCIDGGYYAYMARRAEAAHRSN